MDNNGAVTQEAVSDDPMVQRLESLAKKIVRTSGAKFCIQQTELEIKEMGAHNGILPLLMHYASQVFERAFGRQLPLVFELDKTALCEVVPLIDRESEDAIFSMFALCLHFGVEEIQKRFQAKPELMEGGMVPLDWLYTDWSEAIQRERYRLRRRREVAPNPAAAMNEGRGPSGS